MEVEPEYWHVMYFEGVVIVGILIGVGLGEVVVAVDGGDDVEVVVRSVGVRGFDHVVVLFVAV